MELSEFKKLSNNLDTYTALDVDDFTYMTDVEIEDYQTELENDTGNLSTWDHLRAFLTMKAELIGIKK